MHGVFLDYATVSNADIDPAPLQGALESLTLHETSTQDEIPARVADADIVLVNKCRIGAREMDAAPRLRLIALAATGFNNIDLDAARERGIAVTNIRAYCTPAVVQHVFALLLALNQKLGAYAEQLREEAWKRAAQFTLLDFPFHELAGRRFAVIGYGELGRAVADVATAFGMQVLVAERRGSAARAGRVAFETALREADIISLHCPLTPGTRGMINAETLALCKDSAILINTARGALVDEYALAHALRAGRLGGAGIDVLSEEPPVNGNPLLAQDIPNLIVTPHIAWAAVESRQRAVMQMADCIVAFRRGERLNRVD